MSDLLAQMATAGHARVARARALLDDGALRERALARRRPPPLSLGAFELIAEVKRRAPSAGALAAEVDVGKRARAYADGGATAISVLTEPERFDGALEHLAEAAEASPVPVMRKDFVVDRRQVWEARDHGAGGVLLIARMLDDPTLDACLDDADEAGLFVLLECFDAADCERARRFLAGRRAVLAGVNTRDLRTLEVAPGRLERLVDLLPEGVPRVAESGMHRAEDTARAAALGYGLALVGTALMRAADPTGLVRDMIAAGREAHPCR